MIIKNKTHSRNSYPKTIKISTFHSLCLKVLKKSLFNDKQMKAINEWLQTDAERILFVYGGSDPWYATGVDLKKTENAVNT